MPNSYKFVLFVLFLVIGGILLNFTKNSKIGDDFKFLVISHRGASGYLPEHTLEAKALAVGLGADFLEQDIHMSSDDGLIVAHEFELVSDVRAKYPQKIRQNNKFEPIDFTLDEIKSLTVTSEFKKDNPNLPQYKDRFPLYKSNFKFHTFEEEIEFIQGLEKSMGKKIGIYPEIKRPSFYRKNGKDISLAVLQILKKYGYKNKNDLIFLQTFELNELRRIKTELFPKLDMDLPLVFLISGCGGEAKNYKNKLCADIDNIREITDIVGVDINSLINFKTKQPTEFAKNLQKKNMKIHVWTIKKDTLPKNINNTNELLNLLKNIGVSAIFTDFVDDVIKFNERTLKEIMLKN
ncbi:glycerophosphodiester phosphodiesterase [Campylobacter sp. CN_NA2]|uniref:glycerophosphodiester phosphodiesterase n=1 Tax=Campylobacter sp. CN_NA2 TaxID=2984145 RepID=UPI0022E9E5B5|nr:glycerophosphodiester phosphodiesterase [Campylobacter sp. CN_NA2]MDA3087765.1 glycerophosphodiester phosphodiesterase [Campylobacter sp. CN_NA2]